jgi:polyisoprenoid-binding protein YceI
MRTRDHILRLSIVAGLLFPLVASAKLANPANSEVTFTAIGPAGMKIVGSENELKVNDTGAAVVVTASLQQLKTGISVRDEHVRKALETSQFPTSELEVQRAALKSPKAGETITADATGNLKLHGVTKPTQFHYTATSDGGKIKVTATTRVNANDFGIKVPNYLGITVKPDVDISVKFEITDG